MCILATCHRHFVMDGWQASEMLASLPEDVVICALAGHFGGVKLFGDAAWPLKSSGTFTKDWQELQESQDCPLNHNMLMSFHSP